MNAAKVLPFEIRLNVSIGAAMQRNTASLLLDPAKAPALWRLFITSPVDMRIDGVDHLRLTNP